ncbi:hypothetical protein WJ438_19765 [Streptomyces sp. GD-15H]
MEGVLALLDTGRWHWDTATGTGAVDGVAARLLGLPAEARETGPSR